MPIAQGNTWASAEGRCPSSEGEGSASHLRRVWPAPDSAAALPISRPGKASVLALVLAFAFALTLPFAFTLALAIVVVVIIIVAGIAAARAAAKTASA